MGNVYIGIVLAIMASTMNATGMNLQRYGQRIQIKGTKEEKIWGQRLNGFGVFLSIACGLLDFISYSFAPQSTLAPFGSMTLVVNLIYAPVLHGEKIKALDLISTALVILGVVTCITNGSKVAMELEDTEELLALVSRKICILYGLAITGFIAGSLLYIYSEEQAGNGHLKSVGAFYPLVAGTFASSTALSAKVLGQLIKLKGSIVHIIINILSIVAFAASNMTVNNRGLGNHPPLFIVPIFSTTFLVTNIIGGGVFFNEFSVFTLGQWLGYAVGVSLIISGVLLGVLFKGDELPKKFQQFASGSSRHVRSVSQNTKAK
mmetsp:Transcript_7768/g.9851  ORF Transcript_7768/g.9851 Transcript_7768/m.9851 type:complete len:319 (+) Transcript_7768:158-1114(+)